MDQKKQVIILYLATLIGVLLGIVSSIINTNALPPESYGDVRYVQNIISFVSSILLFGYFVSGSRLLALSDNDQYSRQIRGVMCMILCLTVIVVMIVMLLLSAYFFFHEKVVIAKLFFAAAPLSSNVLMLNYINTTAQGDNHIGRIAIARLVPSFLYCIIAYLIFSRFLATPLLMLALYNGSAIIILTLVIISTKPSFKRIGDSFRLLRQENRLYGFNVYLGSIAGVSTSYITGITLGHFSVDNSTVGFYTLALTMATPLSMLPAIIGTTFFRRFASQHCISKSVWMYSVGMTIASILIFSLSIRFIVAYLYPSTYFSVSRYASWLAIGMGFHGLGDMINRFLGSHGLGRQIRNAAFACGFTITTGSFIFVYLYGIDGAVFSKISSSFIYMTVLLFYYCKYIKK